MTTSDLRSQLELIETQLFASTEPAVIEAIDASADFADAVERLRRLGMSASQARLILDMPLSTRTRGARAGLFAEAELLRSLVKDSTSPTPMSESR